MRSWLSIVLFVACTGPVEPIDPGSVDLAPLTQAVAAWRGDPSDANLERVSAVAGEVSERPIGERTVDLALADALTEVLLRPDLARPRLEAHLASLTESDTDLWLNTLLRSGDVAAFAAEAGVVNGRRYDPQLQALIAASGQSKTHREIDWRRATRAHDAAHLANQHVRLQRKKVDRPVPNLQETMRTLVRLHPNARVQAVFTRATNTDDPDPMSAAGAIPAKAGRRRVVSYAAQASELDAATAAFLKEAPPRTVGVVVQVRPATGSDVVYCGEGRLETRQLWMLSGCDGYRETAWLQATERYIDLVTAGRTEAEATATIRERFAQDMAKAP